MSQRFFSNKKNYYAPPKYILIESLKEAPARSKINKTIELEPSTERSMVSPQCNNIPMHEHNILLVYIIVRLFAKFSV